MTYTGQRRHIDFSGWRILRTLGGGSCSLNYGISGVHNNVYTNERTRSSTIHIGVMGAFFFVVKVSRLADQDTGPLCSRNCHAVEGSFQNYVAPRNKIVFFLFNQSIYLVVACEAGLYCNEVSCRDLRHGISVESLCRCRIKARLSQ